MYTKTLVIRQISFYKIYYNIVTMFRSDVSLTKDYTYLRPKSLRGRKDFYSKDYENPNT